MDYAQSPFDEAYEQRRRLINLLKWLYTEDIDSYEVGSEYQVNRGDRRVVFSEEEQKKHLAYEWQRRGRRNPVSIIATRLLSLIHPSEEHLVFLLIELSEVDFLLSQNHYLPIPPRSCSFLERTFGSCLGTDDSLYQTIKQVYETGLITNQEAKLAQFIRMSRNDISHNFWFETEWSFSVHHLAAVSTITLLNSLLENWFEVDWHVEDRINLDNCIRAIEDEHGLHWDEDESTYENESINERYLREKNLYELSSDLHRLYYGK